MSFGFESTADEVVEGIDLTGKRAVVTGGASGHRHRDRPRAGRAPAPRSRSRSATPTRRGASRPRSARDVRQLDLADLDVGRGVRARLGRPAAHPGQQRRRHGHPGAAAQPGRARAAVRDQPPRPLRARRRPARRAGAARARGSCRSARARTCARRWSSTTSTSPSATYEPFAGLRAVEDRERAVRGRRHRALGARRHLRQRADAGRHRHQPAAPHRTRRYIEPRRARAAGSAQDARAGRRDVGAAWRPRRSSRASAAATTRTAPRPRWSSGVRESRGVARYALDPENADRLWALSERVLGAHVANANGWNKFTLPE